MRAVTSPQPHPLTADAIKRDVLRYALVRWAIASFALVPVAIVGAYLIGIGPALAYVGYGLVAAAVALPAGWHTALAKFMAIHGAVFAAFAWLSILLLGGFKPNPDFGFVPMCLWIGAQSAIASGVMYAATRSRAATAAPLAAALPAVGMLYLDHYSSAAGVWNAVNGLGLCLWAAHHRAEATRLAEHRGVYCLKCGDDVRAVESGKCPECGTRIPTSGAAARRVEEQHTAAPLPPARAGRPQWVIDGAEAGRARRAGSANAANEETKYGDEE